MRMLDLFAGIGGFSLAGHWAGWETAAWCEIDPFCQRVLKHHFPNAEPNSDIKKLDARKYRGAVDIVCGGFPCQPYSAAGKRLGKEDARHLWPEMLRVVREASPRWVVGENVAGLLNWSGGLVFDEVQADLEGAGYEVAAFVLPACAVGAPHRRDRVWIVAHRDGKRQPQQREQPFGGAEEQPERGVLSRPFANADGVRQDTGQREHEKQPSNGGQYAQHDPKQICDAAHAYQRPARTPGARGGIEGNGRGNDAKPELRGEQAEQHIGRAEILWDAAHASSIGQKRRMHKDGRIQAEQRDGSFNTWDGGGAWQDFPTKPPVCVGDDGLPRGLVGISLSSWRNKAVGAFGNAIVPQVAYEIFKAINEIENGKQV